MFWQYRNKTIMASINMAGRWYDRSLKTNVYSNCNYLSTNQYAEYEVC